MAGFDVASSFGGEIISEIPYNVRQSTIDHDTPWNEVMGFDERRSSMIWKATHTWRDYTMLLKVLSTAFRTRVNVILHVFST